ncbi:uncharacterized protein [Physeter macrocephalus]|uniref:Gasdermin PUB domain-containing protein n=1 Tax=Physeter macrocephalus TaxID=9755 RepID=A0A9W2X763_PHYMC|nr:uncharacterized protein LOC102976373 [Physeter catodon]
MPLATDAAFGRAPGRRRGTGVVLLKTTQHFQGRHGSHLLESSGERRPQRYLVGLLPSSGLLYPSPSCRGCQAREESHRCHRPLVALAPPPRPSTVLSDTQRYLLAQCLERGVLPQRLELVASILEPNFNQTEETTFSLPPEVLSSLQSEDVALTRSLVEGCELEPQGPGRQLTWDPGMVPQPSALYVSLAGLQLLAAPGPAALQADA